MVMISQGDGVPQPGFVCHRDSSKGERRALPDQDFIRAWVQAGATGKTKSEFPASLTGWVLRVKRKLNDKKS